MIHDITDQLAYGELVNSQRNSTYGFLRMIGSHTSVVIQLTGNCDSSLYGHHIEFESQLEHRDRGRRRTRVRNYQVGPIGHTSLHVSSRVEDGLSQGELCLEWFGQDGHIRVDQLPVKVRFVRDQSSLSAPANGDLMFDETSPWRSLSELPALEPVEMSSPQFTSLLDEMCDGHNDMRISDVVQPVMRLWKPEELNDRQISFELKAVLANLARHGITLDMCEHFSDRDAYALLVEHLLQAELTFPDLPSVGYVQHLLTHEYCDQCGRDLDEMLDDL